MTTDIPTFPLCPDTLSDQQVEQYWSDGFLAFEGALDPDEVKQAREALSGIVATAVRNTERFEFRPGAGDGNQSGGSFYSRTGSCFFQLEKNCEPALDDEEQLELQVRKYMWFEQESEFLRTLCTSHPKTFGLLDGILDGGHELYQSMALVKPPHVGSEKPWHQDNAYFSVQDMDQVIGTWIALDDVGIENGCMHMLPGRHRLGPLRHHHTFDCEIMPGRIDAGAAVPVPLKAGGILIFHSNLPHQTPPNTSPRRRRALQYHYRQSANQIIPAEEFDEIFREADGTPASCAAARQLGF